MFLPRKLQKRAHPSRTAQSSQDRAKIAAAAKSKTSSTEGDNHIETSLSASSPGLDDHHELSAVSSQNSSAAAHHEAQKTTASSAEAAKLDRLVEFLFLRLSPLSLALYSHEERHQRGTTPKTDLIANIISAIEAQPEGRSTKEHHDAAGRTPSIHFARLLNLIPGLATRCKSISLLSQALQAMRDGPAAAWFTLHADKFQLEWLPTYTHITRQLHTAIGSRLQKSSLMDLTLPRLVYIESIPPRIRTRSHAASYLINLINSLTATNDNAAILAVLEPSLVDRHLMAESSSSPSAAALEDRWISGRGVFLLDSPKSVESLCRTYQWHLADRVLATDAPQKKQQPIRCLDWAKWIEMKQLYLEQQQQQLTRQRSEDPADSSVRCNSQWVTSNADKTAESIERKRPSSPTPIHNHSDSWFLGTILTLNLLHPKPTTLAIPSFTSTSELTPTFFNRHLKPQLEKPVPESISYIHTLPIDNETVVAIRTSHRHLATRLLCNFPELRRMHEAEEQTYWTELPIKVRTAAHNRILALDYKFTSHASTH
ncbi:uncharacterized protein UTRI_06373_B [Ustilago trichophora]|uniref:Uncharacterized protein n=1 Tax=Ustilago trichophora TaxID=86804 RepID=A0A5C3EQN4_9BASI|nr:uncharacterized protein UTRI_06373_B [Ustilago trichophora]